MQDFFFRQTPWLAGGHQPELPAGIEQLHFAAALAGDHVPGSSALAVLQ